MSNTNEVPGEVQVYAFQAFDPQAGDLILATYKAPMPLIEKVGGKPLPGTAETVPRTSLDAQGRYRRIATGWGVLE